MKRLARGGELTPLVDVNVSPWERLIGAALSYADADSEDDAAWQRARRELHGAALGYARNAR